MFEIGDIVYFKGCKYYVTSTCYHQDANWRLFVSKNQNDHYDKWKTIWVEDYDKVTTNQIGQLSLFN